MNIKGLLKVKEMFDDIEIADGEKYLTFDEPDLKKFIKENFTIIEENDIISNEQLELLTQRLIS